MTEEKNNKGKILPQLPGGFRDYLPEEAIIRDRIITTVKNIYEKYGFYPLETSPIEYLGVLKGQGEITKQIYKVYNQHPEESDFSLALRFDLTVPLARVVASNFDKLTFPFKRYQVGYVWRGEKQQKGRYRQFLQFDVDTVGTKSKMADAEMMVIIYETLTNLGVRDFKIHYNHRGILNSLAEKVGLTDPEHVLQFFRIIDKLKSIGVERVLSLLEAPDFKGGLSLDKESLKVVEEFINLNGGYEEKLEKLETLLGDSIIPYLNEIREIVSLVKAHSVEMKYLEFNQTIARGLDYYTGIVFETFIRGQENIGSVMSGGRYDNLLRRFIDRDIPSVGVSLGVDRLIVGLSSLDSLQIVPFLTQVMVTNLLPEAESEALELVTLLRKEGIKTEIYIGDSKEIRTQVGYANRKGIPVVIIIGEEEYQKGIYSVKNMITRRQESVKRDSLLQYIKDILLNIQ